MGYRHGCVRYVCNPYRGSYIQTAQAHVAPMGHWVMAGLWLRELPILATKQAEYE